VVFVKNIQTADGVILFNDLVTAAGHTITGPLPLVMLIVMVHWKQK